MRSSGRLIWSVLPASLVFVAVLVAFHGLTPSRAGGAEQLEPKRIMLTRHEKQIKDLQQTVKGLNGQIRDLRKSMARLISRSGQTERAVVSLQARVSRLEKENEPAKKDTAGMFR